MIETSRLQGIILSFLQTCINDEYNIMNKRMLELRNTLAEEGYEFTPAEIEEALEDALKRIRKGRCKKCGKEEELRFGYCFKCTEEK